MKLGLPGMGRAALLLLHRRVVHVVVEVGLLLLLLRRRVVSRPLLSLGHRWQVARRRLVALRRGRPSLRQLKGRGAGAKGVGADDASAVLHVVDHGVLGRMLRMLLVLRYPLLLWMHVHPLHLGLHVSMLLLLLHEMLLMAAAVHLE